MMKFLRSGSLALALAAWATSAAAGDWYTGSNAPGADQSFGASLNSSLSGTSQGDLDLALIGTISPFTKLDRSGVRFRLGANVGDYDYLSSVAGVGLVHGREQDGSLLAGWAWVNRRTSVGVYAGPEVRSDVLNKFDPGNTAPATSLGFQTSVDVYSNPTPYTMVFGQLSYSTIRQAYYSHFKLGFAVAKNVFVGPEALFLGDDLYRQWRAGLHLTGVPLGNLQFGVSGGYLKDETRGGGTYGILDMRMVF